ncbi:unnamed protein product [Tilletia laevis]|uniref:Uncharacterized protein n=2 Tax=Tilletia TaxID=13289 RepID=A0A9N8QGH9_9BASI|nr:unnamed protein product [Tilletia laevis]
MLPPPKKRSASSGCFNAPEQLTFSSFETPQLCDRNGRRSPWRSSSLCGSIRSVRCVSRRTGRWRTYLRNRSAKRIRTGSREAILNGSTATPLFSATWPTAEMAGMNVEGAVTRGMKKQLVLVKDEQERKEMFYGTVAEMYELGWTESMASKLEVDTVIDPADTRKWLLAGLRSVPRRVPTWQSAMGARAARL